MLTIPQGHPKVMLTTCAGEQHVLGLLMAEALFRLSACEVLAFGADLPLTEMARPGRALMLRHAEAPGTGWMCWRCRSHKPTMARPQIP